MQLRIKKSLTYLLPALLLVVAGGLLLCLNRPTLWADPTILTVTVVSTHPAPDLSALTANIASAQSLYNSATEGTLPGQYPAPLKANLLSAILAASAINNSYTQSQVDAAALNLQTAMNTFSAGMIDLTPLHAAIVTAQNDLSHAVVGVAAGNYAQASVDTLSAAVVVAQGIVSAIAQSVILTATATLKTATAFFEGSVVLANNQILLAPSTSLTSATPEAVVTSGNTATSSIIVPLTVTNPTLDLSILVTQTATSSSATTPGDIVAHVTTPVGVAVMTIPGAAVITSSDILWDGTFNLLQNVSTSLVSTPSISGQPTSAVMAVEIGAGSTPLTLDTAVRIAMTGKAGYFAGFSYNGSVTPIETVCADDTQATNNLLPADGDCRITVGQDMVIWTKHFTKFVAYSVTTSSGGTTGSSGGGGGGGLLASIPPPYSPTAGSVILRGLAYASSTVTLMQDGQITARTLSDVTGAFEFTLSNITPGVYTYGVQAADSHNTRSTLRTVTVIVTPAAGTIISGVLLPPTISADKTQAKQGSAINFFGQSVPGAPLSLLIRSLLQHTVAKSLSANAATGEWQSLFLTDSSAPGAYTASIISLIGTSTPLSADLSFIIGNADVSKQNLPAAILALSPDGVVNLNDFSVLAYWYKRPLTAAGAKADLNHDGVIDLKDFSILAYYWSGN